MRLQSPSGLNALPLLQWGSHICQVYETEDDLRDLLVPYFKAGLENNESCLWVTGAPFGANQARAALRAAIGDFDTRESSGQIEIRDAHEWYAAGEKLKPQDIVTGLLQREQTALDQGYEGLRTNGNCSWVQLDQWVDFQQYESLVQQAIRGRRMICSCSYCFDHHQGAEMLDVMQHHDFVLPRTVRNGDAGGRSGRAMSAPRNVATFAGILEALPAAIYTTDAQGFLTYYNKAAADLWGYRPAVGTQQWCGSWKLYTPDGTPVPLDQCPMAVAMQSGKAVHGVELEAERPDGARVPCTVYPTPLFDDDGKVIGGINLFVDISERKAAEERSVTLVREMNHRVQNTLATVQAILASTARHATTMAEFQRSFTDRITAMSKTHGLLTRGARAGVSLRELLDSELAMFADGDDSRVTLVGPDITLSERIAVPLGMAIHELATNAAKYGAFSILGGTLSVHWGEGRDSIEMRWRERKVPMSGDATRAGFGSRLLKEIVPRQIGATVHIRYEPDGVDARMSIPTAD